MAGVVGKSSRKSDKFWRDALMIATKRNEAETLELLADKGAPMIARAAARCVLAATAAEPDIAAMKEIGDRLDGKPHQSVEVETTSTRYVINATADKPTRDEWKSQHAPAPKTATIQ